MTDKQITSFTGKYAFLSNFYFLNGKTVEHYFQAAKTDNSLERSKIMEALTPHEAKHFGRKVTLRPDWEEVKIPIMIELLNNKFEDRQLSDMLVDTGDSLLVEGNTWHDNVWGNCIGRECVNQPGHNWLGVILMSLRAS